ncbi:hypothetical protein PAXRUDRAFT_20654 [Paxillus rubicundulus Ve08.2h10]|uniref:Uncharacterized protein n=1 Tax=Paxillus rubicundulus Ve08.2h10 TaxID=930991 RepID=A0A0D0CDI3_9AGAM|nr:hypothetical protein PAXRUDRAFT_20654 [Paxillus rubicundulus Ve08.2h10]
MNNSSFLRSPFGPGMDRCWMDVTIDLNVIGAASDLRKIFEHFPPENNTRMHHIFWHRIRTLMDTVMAIIGHAVLLGITPLRHPILQYIAHNAGAMEADGFKLEDIPPFKGDLAESHYRAIAIAPVDAWWEDLNALSKDPKPTDWEYIPNVHRNHQFWDILKEFSQRSAGHDIPHQSLSQLLYNIRNSISQSLGYLTQDINSIQADIEATTKSLSHLLS